MADNKEYEEQEFDLEKKISVSSIAGWPVGFARRAEGIGDVSIAPRGSVRLTRNEVITQCQIGNKLFTGIDGRGNHATLYINDKDTRVELGFEDKSGKNSQAVYSDKKLKELFNISDFEKFKVSFKDAIKTRAEKYMAIEGIGRLNLNDYNKIRFVEEYTGYKI